MKVPTPPPLFALSQSLSFGKGSALGMMLQAQPCPVLIFQGEGTSLLSVTRRPMSLDRTVYRPLLELPTMAREELWSEMSGFEFQLPA